MNRLSRYCEGVMEAGWLLAVIIAPLFFDIYSSRVFEPDKITSVRSIALFILAAWIVKIANEGGFRFDNIGREKFSSFRGFFSLPFMAAVVAVVASYTISTAFSVAPNTSLLGSYQRLQGTFTTFSYIAIFAAIAGNLRRRSQAERFATVVILTSFPIAFYGILQRYQLDPLPWGGDTTQRVTGNMGNAIFVAAYLIMAIPLVIGRVITSFRAILIDNEGGRMPLNIVRATAYVFILAVDAIGFWYAGSRGPLLGLLAGLFFFGVLMFLFWRNRVLTLAWLGMFFVMGGAILVMNIDGGPLDALRQSPTFLGRLGHVLDEIQGREGTGRVRILIANGIVKLILPHEPLEFPEGGSDVFNVIRPIIGYGPESLYVSYNRFYPPELGQLEARNASPDRSHNETFDALANTGLLGLVAYMILFVSVFYYGLKWLGFMGSRRRQIVFFILVFGGGAASATAFVQWQGPEFFGVGLPFGMILGLIAFLTLYALRAGMEETSQEPWREIMLISLLSAIFAHFVEIHFGIAIVSTRTHFWAYLGLMFVLGYVLPNALRASTPVPVPASATPTPPPVEENAVKLRRRQRAATVKTQAVNDGGREGFSAAFLSAGLVASVLIVLGYDFITNASRTAQAGRIISESFITKNGQPSYGIFGMIALTWFLGSLLSYLEEAQLLDYRKALSGIGITLAGSLIGGGVSWLLLSNHLARVASFTPSSIETLLSSADNIAATLTWFYFFILVAILGLAFVLPADWPGGSMVRSLSGRPALDSGEAGAALFVYALLPLIAMFLSVVLNLQVIQADIIYKTAQQFDDQGQPQISIQLYQRAIDISPGEDYYYLFLGRAYLNATGAAKDEAERDGLLSTAEQKLEQARVLNPLNTDHTANLARLNRQWAAIATNPEVRAQKANVSDLHYGEAVKLSPKNAGLWNEWAALLFQLMDAGDRAQEKIDVSLQLDQKFEQTYQFQADLYVWHARRETDPAKQKEWYEKAIPVYQAGIAVARERVSQHPFELLVNLATTCASAGNTQCAIDSYNEALLATSDNNVRWQIFRALAQLSYQKGDTGAACSNAQQSLSIAPEANKAEMQNFVDAACAAPAPPPDQGPVAPPPPPATPAPAPTTVVTPAQP